MTTIGIVLFPDVEELDFAGPWEVLTAGRLPGDEVLTVAEAADPVRAAKGLRVLPDVTIDDCPPLDVVVVPGGAGTRNGGASDRLVEWLTSVVPGCRWVTSVCTGAFLLARTGVLAGRTATTHWAFVDELRQLGGFEVVDDRRYVVDGPVVTAAGVSAGIDMALWLVGELHGAEHGALVQKIIQYAPEPPFAPA